MSQLQATPPPTFATTTAFGVYLKTSKPEFMEIAAAAGLDFVRIDLQHGSADAARVAALIAAARRWQLDVGVRLPKDPAVTASILALGVDSVTFPGVQSAAEAVDLVNWCAGRAGLISVQIETRRGMEQVNEIARVDGVDVLHCGRADLARSLGLVADEQRAAQLDAAEDSILLAAAAAGKRGAMHWPPGAGNLERIQRWVADGIAWLTLGADTQILRSALTQRFELASGHAADAQQPTKEPK